MTKATLRPVCLAAVLALASCGGPGRTTLDAREWVDRELVETTMGVDVVAGDGMASGESVIAFDLADGEILAIAAHYADQELASQPPGDVVERFAVDCVSVVVHATGPDPGDTGALAAGVRERMQVRAPSCPSP